MRILYFGTSAFAIPALQALVAHQHSVTVVTQPDRPAGRGGKLAPPPIKTAAQERGLPVLQPESCRSPEFLHLARGYAPDLIVVAAYGQFLPDSLLQLPARGSVNLHGSLLPRYRGAAPIQRAMLKGETRTGVCLLWMVREMDAGDVIACTETPITPDDTAGTLTARLASLATELLLAWLPALEQGTAPRHPQSPEAVTFAPPIRREERELDWTRPAEELWRQVRALAPTPAAVTTFRGLPVKVLAAHPLAEQTAGAPGEILTPDLHRGLHVQTGAGVLEVLCLQPAGKRPMSGADFLRGAHVAVGERFGV